MALSADSQFQAAVERVRGHGDSSTKSVTDDTRLSLYALYKQATVGPCTVPRPSSLFDFTGKAKWDAWHRLGTMTREKAAEDYVALVGAVLPVTATTTAKTPSSSAPSNQAPTTEKPREKWVVMSRPVDSGDGNDEGDATVFKMAAAGDVNGVVAMLKAGQAHVNAFNSAGLTLLIIAADRGNVALAQALLEQFHADPNLPDHDGTTPLEYAHICDNPDIAQLLTMHGAKATTSS